MKLNNLVFTALVALFKAIVDAYLPQFPISLELINTILLALLALVGVDVTAYALRNTRVGANLK